MTFELSEKTQVKFRNISFIEEIENNVQLREFIKLKKHVELSYSDFDFDVDWENALYFACKTGNLDIVKIISKKCINLYITNLDVFFLYCCDKNKIKIMSFLYDIHYKYNLKITCFTKGLKILFENKYKFAIKIFIDWGEINNFLGKKIDNCVINTINSDYSNLQLIINIKQKKYYTYLVNSHNYNKIMI